MRSRGGNEIGGFGLLVVGEGCVLGAILLCMVCLMVCNVGKGDADCEQKLSLLLRLCIRISGHILLMMRGLSRWMVILVVLLAISFF